MKNTCTYLLLWCLLLSVLPCAAEEGEEAVEALPFKVSDYQVLDIFNEEGSRTNGTNVGARLSDIDARPTAEDTVAISNLLASYDILFVPGLISDVILAAAKMDKVTDYGGYFAPQIKWLRTLAGEGNADMIGLVDVESEGSVAANADKIRKAILKKERPVILVGHSKGGLDILDMLIHYDDMRERVAGWIAIQSPFLGSPLANVTYDNKALRLPTDLAFQILGGSDHSLHDLSTAARGRYFKRHKKHIDDILSKTPHLSCVTWVDEELPSNPIKSTMRRIKSRSLFRKDAYSFLKITRDYMLLRESDLHNDGMVPRVSAVLPGAKYVAITGPDHAAIVTDFGLSVFNRRQRCHLVVSLLTLLGEDLDR